MSDEAATIPRDSDHASHAMLTIEMDGSRVLAGTLQYLAAQARVSDGVVLPFLYREAVDEENPEAPRPVRRARLVIEELGTLA